MVLEPHTGETEINAESERIKQLNINYQFLFMEFQYAEVQEKQNQFSEVLAVERKLRKESEEN